MCCHSSFKKKENVCQHPACISKALKDFRKLAGTTEPSEFSHTMSPKVSYYTQCKRILQH